MGGCVAEHAAAALWRYLIPSLERAAVHRKDLVV
jgi:hypothetical protein